MEVDSENCGNEINKNSHDVEDDLIGVSTEEVNSSVVKNASSEENLQNDVPSVVRENIKTPEINSIEENAMVSVVSTEENLTTETENIEDSDIIETENDTEEINGTEDGEMMDNADNNPDKTVQRLTRLPVSRIKSIMKFDDDVNMATQEAIFLVTKATELFINCFMKEVHQCTIASKKKTISKRDVDTAIFSKDCFMFLDGALD